MNEESDAGPERVATPYQVIGAVMLVLIVGVGMFLWNDSQDSSSAMTSSEAAETLAESAGLQTREPVAPRTVQFCWNGSRLGSVDVSWMLDGNYEQQDDRKNNQCVDITGTRPGDHVSFSAQAASDRSMDVSCRILVDGVAVEEAKSSGRYVIASCSGRV